MNKNDVRWEDYDLGYADRWWGNEFRPPVGKLSRQIAYTEGYETADKELKKNG